MLKKIDDMGAASVTRKQLSPSGTFYRQRDEWIKSILRRPKAELSHVEKLVAIYIVETINPVDRAWVTSQERIADDMEIGIRIVKSAVSKLKAMGLIRAKRVSIKGNGKLFNCYSMVPVDEASPMP